MSHFWPYPCSLRAAPSEGKSSWLLKFGATFFLLPPGPEAVPPAVDPAAAARRPGGTYLPGAGFAASFSGSTGTTRE